MKYRGHSYTVGAIGDDFKFAIMWHTSPARALSVTRSEDAMLAVNNAYRDMMPRTIDGLGLSMLDKLPGKAVKKEDKNALRGIKAELLKELRENLAKNIIEKVFLANSGAGDFNDSIHQTLCNEFIADFKAKVGTLNRAIDDFNKRHSLTASNEIKSIDTDKITYGKAQKIVNMSMKQLYCFDDACRYHASVFQYCHIPLDSIILEFFKLNHQYVWSNLDDTAYSEVQTQCRKKWEKKTSEAGFSAGDDFTKLFFAEFIIWDAGSEREGKASKKNIDSIEIDP